MMKGSVGDDTLPLVFGLILFGLGVIQTFLIRNRRGPVSLPKGKMARRMIGTMLDLFIYLAILPFLGYALSTFVCSAFLFWLFGGYRWPLCLLAALVLASALHFVFISFLQLPFPPGIFRL